MARTLTKIWTEAEKAAWRLPEKLTVSQWADANRVLDSRTSAEPGQWRTSRTPYIRGIMDAFTDPEVEEITVVKPPQSAGTEAIYNMIGYCIAEDPSPALLVMPRDEDCDYAVENRLRPMVQASPALLNHTTGRIWDLSKREFYFARMTLYFAGSNSPAGLGTKPVRYLFLDETDKYPPFAGKEANPIDLATKRTITFWDRKIVKVSTPTTTDGHITTSYEKSNKQQYYIPCPHCGQYSVWKFGQLKIPKDLRAPDLIRKLDCCWYECEFCKGKIEEAQKDQLVAAGIWLPEGQKIIATEFTEDSEKRKKRNVNLGALGALCGKSSIHDSRIIGTPKRDKRHSGFHFSALISPWVGWSEIMAQWFEANTEEGIAIGKLMDFKNAILAEPWVETGKRTEQKELKKQIGTFSKGTVPSDCLVLVAGADYHEDARGVKHIEYEVRGFGYGEKNWVIQTGSVADWDVLDEEVLLSPFPWADGTPNEQKPWLAVVLMFVDSGFKKDEVYKYTLKRPGLTISTKGASHPQRAPLVASKLEKNLQTKKRYRGMLLFLVDTAFFKDKVTTWVQPQMNEEGEVIIKPLTEFYAELPDYYFKEFSNEHKVKVRNSRGEARWEWRPVSRGAKTHSLDTAVLCAAAAFYKGVHYLRRPGEKRIRPAAAKKKKITLSELQQRRRLKR